MKTPEALRQSLFKTGLPVYRIYYRNAKNRLEKVGREYGLAEGLKSAKELINFYAGKMELTVPQRADTTAASVYILQNVPDRELLNTAITALAKTGNLKSSHTIGTLINKELKKTEKTYCWAVADKPYSLLTKTIKEAL